MTKLVHFVGVSADQYPHAVKVWGLPAFTHPRATWSCMGEISEHDLVVLGRDAFPARKVWRSKRAAHDE